MPPPPLRCPGAGAAPGGVRAASGVQRRVCDPEPGGLG
eukprot:CAMPEP_0179348570 /NCGR_PEP_ID=MMETSP0797-20121207/73771_1 /TAXON_ID=47934 /ORGANISM="Dinophysis acuminata, Strain DAEP01" /LENGTH=37 /DNA_ID= /DNA_START= /DNA_END= /DNA_ORIENTATION=